MPTPTHKPKAIITDVDRTLTDQVTWYKLTEELGGDVSEHAKLFNSYIEEKISFQSAKTDFFKMLLQHGPITRKRLMKIFSDVHLKGEAFATFNELRERGYELCLISSSIDLFVETVAKRLGIKYWYANAKLIFDQNDNWIDFEADRNMAELKVKQLENFLVKTHLTKNDCVALGQDSNDTALFLEIPGIAVHSTYEHLINLSWKTVEYLPRILQVIESIPD